MNEKLTDVFNNIFHSFSKASKISHNENQITRSFISMLEHSDINLKHNFLEEFIDRDIINVRSKVEYELQLGKRPIEKYNFAYILTVSDDGIIEENSDDQDESNIGIPDAVFKSKDFCIAVEVKIRGARVRRNQVNRHIRWFQDGQEIKKVVSITWDQVFSFLKRQKEEYESCTVTYFLINQFLQYCTNNEIGSLKERTTSFYHLPVKECKLAFKIDEFILNEFNELIDKSKQANSGGVSYTRKVGNGFFAKIETKANSLILSFDPESNYSTLVKERLRALGLDKKQNQSTPPREAWIDLRKVDNLEVLKDFIIEAFNNRK